jgi:hypothetical protein
MMIGESFVPLLLDTAIGPFLARGGVVRGLIAPLLEADSGRVGVTGRMDVVDGGSAADKDREIC